MKLYKTLIKPIASYRTETWTLSKANVNRLNIFERKMARKIYRAVNEEGKWRIRSNNGIQ